MQHECVFRSHAYTCAVGLDVQWALQGYLHSQLTGALTRLSGRSRSTPSGKAHEDENYFSVTLKIECAFVPQDRCR